MFLLNLIKRFSFLQNLVATLLSYVSPIIEHNLGKYVAIKKALYMTALEGLDGDYLEFGVFTGSAFVFATKSHKRMKWIGPVHTKFFGFDSFQGFGSESKRSEKHPFYKDEIFSVDFDRVKKNIERQTKGIQVKLVKGFFSESLDGHSPIEYGAGKARIIFIDCDLKEAALSALRFCKTLFQEGTILILDDYFSFKGKPDMGVSGAFAEFQAEFPKASWRSLYHYGYLGQAFICSGVEK